MNQCASQRDACKAECKATIPWIQWAARNNCKQTCDQVYGECMADWETQVANQSIQQQLLDATSSNRIKEMLAGALKWIIIIAVVVLVIVLIAKNWQKLGLSKPI